MAKVIRTTEWKVRPENYEIYYKNRKKDSFYKVALKHLKAWLKH